MTTLTVKLRVPVAVALALGVTWGSIGCGVPDSRPRAGSNSNWLASCESSSTCEGNLECVCGTCSRECGESADCAELAGASCVEAVAPGVAVACTASATQAVAGLCLPPCEPGGCGLEQVCVDGACVPAPTPENDFCGGLTPPDQRERALADQLWGLLQEARAEGVGCGGGTLSAPVARLRFDTRLRCAARALALDLEATREESLVDSEGRSTLDRMALAGYAAGPWAEGFAFVTGDGDAAGALAVILGDPAICPRIVDQTYLDAGVGTSGDAYVVTLGAE